MMPRRTLAVVLGSGYVARYMVGLRSLYGNVLYTSREPDHHLPWVPENARIRFNLGQQETWRNVPSDADLLWCFPAAPLQDVQAFVQAAGFFAGNRRMVVLGSTSAYDVAGCQQDPPPWVDETAPLDFSKPRVQGEEFLRNECRAILLRVAGIYGPGRSPYAWIRSGRVRLSDKYVNLIHVEDLAAVCLAALLCGELGAAYNVSDGIPRTWREIGRQLAGNQEGEAPAERPPQSGKRVSTGKLRVLLEQAGMSIRHQDVFRSLERLGDEHTPGTPP